MLKLAENGSTRYSIQIAPDANLVTVHAAEELSRFLEEITGARFNILTADERPEGPVVAVGRLEPFAAFRYKSVYNKTTGDRSDRWLGASAGIRLSL